jgi:hypothetical protein
MKQKHASGVRVQSSKLYVCKVFLLNCYLDILRLGHQLNLGIPRQSLKTLL